MQQLDPDHIRRCAQTVASDFLQTKMRKPEEIHVSILRCVILNAISFGITDEDFIGKVFASPHYRTNAKAVRDAVGSHIGTLIGRTCDMVEAT